MLIQKRPERWILQNFMSLHLMGVKDKHFLSLQNKLLDQNALVFCYNTDRYPVYYIWS